MSHQAETGTARWRIQAIRIAVQRPMFVRWDTATGEVTFRSIIGRESFEPIAPEEPPGKDDPLQVGRFEISVAQSARGSVLLRLDSVTGRVWSLNLARPNWRWVELSTGDEVPVPPTRVAGDESQGQPIPKIPVEELLANTDTIPSAEILLDLISADDTPDHVRVVIVPLLAAHYPEQAEAPLLEALRVEKDPAVLVAVIDAISLDWSPKVAPAVQRLEGHEDPRVADAARAKLSQAP